MEISDQIIKSILENEKKTVNLLGFWFKVGWMKVCTHDDICHYAELRLLGLISSQGFFARVCASLILNNLFLLRSPLYYILWRVLFFFAPHECLVVFAETCLEREFELKDEGKDIHRFIRNTRWMHKRRFFIDMYDAKNVYTVAQLYLMSRDEPIINYSDYGVSN